jgi:hypothetical protein
MVFVAGFQIQFVVDNLPAVAGGVFIGAGTDGGTGDGAALVLWSLEQDFNAVDCHSIEPN